MKGRQLHYSKVELSFIEARRTLSRAAAYADWLATFNRSDVSFNNFKALCKRRGWLTGRTGRFVPGAEPVNKGQKCEPGKGGLHPNARATQFKKGVRQGVAVALYKPIDTERLSKEGYLERKVHDGMPLQSRWRAVHRLNWEAIHGPLPKGLVLKCLDGDRRNTAPSNWEAIPRALLPHLIAHRGLDYDGSEPEVRPAILAVAKVKHAVKKAVQS